MKPSSYEATMHRVLDGEATPEEAAALQRALAADAELQGRFEELQRLFSDLEAVASVEPPVHFRDEVIRHIRERGPLPRRSASRFAAGLRSWREHLSPQLAYVFVAGGIVGIALFSALDGRWRDGLDGGSPGTMLPLDRYQSVRVVDSVDLRAPGFEGVVRTRALEGSLLAEIEFSTGAAATVELDYDARLSVVGVEPAGASTVSLEPGRIRVEHQGSAAALGSSRSRYRVLFAGGGSLVSSLQVRVATGGTTLEKVVRTVPGNP